MTSYPILGALSLFGVDSSGVEWFTENVVGWGAPDSTLAPVGKPRQPGAWGGLSYSKARPLVLSGVANAPTPAAATDASNRLIVAASLDDTVLSVVEPTMTRWVTVRRDGGIEPVWLSPTAFSWSIQLVALDPRKMGAPLTASTGLPASSGGLTVPFTVPFTVNSTVVSGQASLTNPGNTAGPVVLRIDGPVTGPVITHVGTGLQLIFSASLSLLAGEFLLVDMEARTAMANGQANRANWITSRGWSSMDPGPNTWAFTAQSYTAGARLTITATPSWQ